MADSELLAAYAALMTPEERAVEARFVLPRHRRQYRVTRALVRTVLAAYLGTDPASLRFEPGPWGRPELARRRDHGLSWNLAHTDGLVVLLVAEGCAVGVDVEDIVHRKAPLDVAGDHFAPSEVASLRALPLPAQPRRFFEYWTLKESYIKARGMGLAIPLGDFAFDSTADSGPTISFQGLDDDPSDWQFTLVAPTACHLAAAAFHRRRTPERIIEVRAVTPLIDT